MNFLSRLIPPRHVAPTLVAPPVTYAPTPTRARSFRARPYQATGIEFLRSHHRSILADAPGLGKTFQACEAAELPVLVSCPLSLVEQWAEFIRDQYPLDRVIVAAYGDVIKRHDAMEQPFDWLIINHDMFRKFFPPSVKTLIVDEFHHFRNREAKRSRGLFVYAAQTERVYGLTATPVFKDVGDLWHLLHILNRRVWSSYWNYIKTYAVTVDYGWGMQIIKTRNEQALQYATRDYMLSRTYKQVGMFLPKRIDKHVLLRLDNQQRKQYITLRDQYRLEIQGQEAQRFFNAGAVLHKLRQLTMTPEKIAAIKELVEDTCASTKRPIVIFTWYRETAQRIADAINGELITGDMPPEERREAARHSEKQVRVCTIESLSEGVDLSASRTCIFAEETYVPGQQYQAISRLLRHSEDANQEPVILYWVRYLQTVDETVHNAVQRRVSSAHQILREALAQ